VEDVPDQSEHGDATPQRRQAEARASSNPLTRNVRWLAVFLIRFYQNYIRPHLFGRCRFNPTCSDYGVGCVESFGVVRGGWLIVKRLARCHPLAKGGFDPVPRADCGRPSDVASDHGTR